ncbi:MAG TPA: AAA family ATPase [Anaerolineales bacterium]|nr:AAA family ATPase [Anaerolineales bacterium]
MDPFNPYLSIDRRFALASGRDLPARARGGVLFADIRGFTTVTELLAGELGPSRGADELAAWLERLYDAIIAPVDRYAGSVISLSGDAILCWFDDRPPVIPEGLQSGARRATACALEIREKVGALSAFRTPSGQEVRLGIKITVTAGDARRLLVGDPAIQVFDTLAGQLLARSAGVDHLLKESEVAVGAEVIGHFGDEIRTAEWRIGDGGEHYRIVSGLNREIPETPWPEAPVVPEEVARPFILRPVYERIRTGQQGFLADLRPATAMFISFTGIDYDLDEAAGQKLDSLVRWVQSVLIRYEAYPLQITIGDKGSYLYAVFGAPASHEDDSLRAARAACDLQSPPAQLDFMRDIRIGISNGIVYAGAYGSRLRRSFGVQGSEVNISARLMSMADSGQILITRNVADGLRGRFDTEPLGKYALKGVSKSIPVFELKGYRGYTPRSSGDRSDLVGRERELAALRSLVDDTVAGQTRTVVLEGDPGIGKSILLETWAAELRSSGVEVYEGSGSAIEVSTAYFVWQPVFRRLLGIREHMSLAEAQEVVLQRLARSGAEALAPLLNRVLTLNFPETEAIRQMDNEGRGLSTVQLLIGLLETALGDRPAVIALDDCQYLDSASWVLILRTRVEFDRMMLVLSGRPFESEQRPPEFRQLLDRPETHLIVLGSLDREHTAALIRNRLDVEEAPSRLVDMIMGAAEGHPFFSEEIVYALRDTGILRIADGRCVLEEGITNLADLNFPLTVQGVVTSRIDRLDGDRQLTLKTASVIGRVFAVQTLRDIHPAERGTPELVPDQLEALNRLNLVLPEELEPSLRYIFKHSITHGVVYQMMTLAQRQTLHRRAAEWYESRFADNLAPHYPLLAYHWARTDDGEKAIDTLEAAGEEAFRNFANAEAVRFFREALDRDTAAGFPNPVGRRARWELLCGEAFVHWTRYRDARAHIERGLELLEVRVPRTPAGQVFSILKGLSRQTLHRFFPTVFLASKEIDRDRLLAASRASQRLVEVYYHSGELLGATYLTFQALNLAELAEESAELVEAYAGAAPFFYFIGMKGLSEAHFRRARRAHEAVNVLRAYAFYLVVWAGVRIGEGDWDQARSASLELIAAGEQLGSVRRENDGRQHQMLLELIKGSFHAGSSAAAELLPAARRIQDARFEGYALFGQAYCAFFHGDLDFCLAVLDQLARLYIDEGAFTDEQLALNMYGLRSLFDARRGEVEAAMKNAAEAEKLMAGAFQASWFTLPGYLTTAEAYFHLWEAGEGGADLPGRVRPVVAALGRYARTFPIGKPAHALYSGLMQYLSGKPLRARKTWLGALEKWEDLMPYEAGRLHLELARRELGLDPAARSRHRRAAEASSKFSRD